MSLASDFILKYKDRRQEELINATDLLARRLASLRGAKAAENASLIAMGGRPKHRNINPTINDILQSHCLHVVKKYSPFVNMAYQYIKIGAESGMGKLLDSEQVLRFALWGNQGHFIHDMYLHLVIQPIGIIGDENIKYQYCDYPGVRVCKNVVFNAREGYKLDEYSSDNVILQTQNFKTTENNKYAWNDMVGQENPKEATYYHPDYSMAQSYTYRNGHQTPRLQQKALELWIPLQFWFNKDFGQSFPFAAVNNNQTNVEITLEKLSKIIRATDRNGNVIPLPIKELAFQKCDLYVNNIFLTDIVFDSVFTRGIRQLIRVNREQRKTLIKSNGTVLLKSMEFALEELYFGFRPRENLIGADSFKRWHMFSTFEQEDAPIPVIIQNLIVPAQQLVVRTAEVITPIPTIQGVSFHIQGKIVIYDNFTGKFFNQTTPHKFKKLNSPTDPGSMMVSWRANSEKYNPNGHLSLRNNHELSIEYTSDTINKDIPTELVVVGQSINFLVIQDKNCTLEQIT